MKWIILLSCWGLNNNFNSSQATKEFDVCKVHLRGFYSPFQMTIMGYHPSPKFSGKKHYNKVLQKITEQNIGSSFLLARMVRFDFTYLTLQTPSRLDWCVLRGTSQYIEIKTPFRLLSVVTFSKRKAARTPRHPNSHMSSSVGVPPCCGFPVKTAALWRVLGRSRRWWCEGTFPLWWNRLEMTLHYWCQ